MHRDAIESAARFLLAARERRLPVAGIPAEFRPSDPNEALAVQRRVTELVGEPIGGWKCAMPTDARPWLYGPIYSPSIVSDGPYPFVGSGAISKVEPEIAFVLARDLPPRTVPYADVEVQDAVREVRLVLEILGPRYADPKSVTYPELLADGVANQGLYVGPVVHGAFENTLDSIRMTIRGVTGAPLVKDGKHPDGQPLRPLCWLANHMAAQGTPLLARQIVTTGSYCGVIEVPLDVPVTFAFGELGELTATLTRAR